MMNTIASNMTGEERVEFEAYAKVLGEYLDTILICEYTVFDTLSFALIVFSSAYIS